MVGLSLALHTGIERKARAPPSWAYQLSTWQAPGDTFEGSEMVSPFCAVAEAGAIVLARMGAASVVRYGVRGIKA